MPEQLNLDSKMILEAERKSATLFLVRENIIKDAMSLVGTRSNKYIDQERGMDSIEGFDCSGFVKYVFHKALKAQDMDLHVPRHANEQWREFGEFVSYRQRKAGDLVFFPSKMADGIRVIGHVGIVLDAVSYVHAPGKDNTFVRVDDLPYNPVELNDIQPKDIHTHSPAGIKRITLPIGNGRWHVQ